MNKNRFQLMGIAFFALAICFSLFSYFAYAKYEQREGYLMVSLVLCVMGAYCLTARKSS